MAVRVGARSHWLFRCVEISQAVAYRDGIEKKNLIKLGLSIG